MKLIKDENIQAQEDIQILKVDLEQIEDTNFKIELKPMIIVEKVVVIDTEQAKLDNKLLEKHKGVMKGKMGRA